LVDLIDYAAKNSEQPIELYSSSWIRCQQDVIAGRAQALFAMIKTKKRQEQFAFPPKENLSTWHMWLAQYPVFTPKNIEFDIETYIPNKGIGAPLGYVVWNILEQQNWLSPFQYEPIEGLKMLTVNSLDGYVVEKLIGLHLIQENNLIAKIQMNQYSVLDTKWYLPFNKDFYNKNRLLVHDFWKHMAVKRLIAKNEFETTGALQ
jgi:polar amino acid transport system substrate-binding protein